MGYTSWDVVFGEQPSAAKWNILGTNDSSFNDGSGIGNGNATLSNIYCFRAYASGSTTLTDATFVTIAFATENYDYGSNFATPTYTAPVAGIYHFDGCVTHASGSATPVIAVTAIFVNGVQEINGGAYAAQSGGGNAYNVSGDILLAASDAVTLRHYQDSAGGEATDTNDYGTWFSGHLVHKT